MELLFILIIALVVLGPENLVKNARKMGQWIYRLVRSPMWATFINTSKELREIPEKLVREAGIEESLKELKTETQKISQDIRDNTAPINLDRPENQSPPEPPGNPPEKQ